MTNFTEDELKKMNGKVKKCFYFVQFMHFSKQEK